MSKVNIIQSVKQCYLYYVLHDSVKDLHLGNVDRSRYFADAMWEIQPYWKKTLDHPSAGIIRSFIERFFDGVAEFTYLALRIYCEAFWIIYPIWLAYMLPKCFKW